MIGGGEGCPENERVGARGRAGVHLAFLLRYFRIDAAVVFSPPSKYSRLRVKIIVCSFCLHLVTFVFSLGKPGWLAILFRNSISSCSSCMSYHCDVLSCTFVPFWCLGCACN